MKERTQDELNDFKRFSWLFRDLQKLSRQVHKIDENMCNGYRNEQDELKAEKKQKKLLLKATEIAESLGFKIYHQSDPRGCSLYLITQQQNGSSLNYYIDYTQGIPVY